MTRTTSLTVPADFYDALKHQCAASKREVRRLRGWLRWILLENGNSVSMVCCLTANSCEDALSGKPAPRRRIAR